MPNVQFGPGRMGDPTQVPHAPGAVRMGRNAPSRWERWLEQQRRAGNPGMRLPYQKRMRWLELQRQRLAPGGPGAIAPGQLGPGNGGHMVAPGQVGDPSQKATGFVPPQPANITINVGTGGSESKQPAMAAGGRTAQRTRQRQALRRYGQQQGMGQGYQPPRRAIGGFQQPYGMQRQTTAQQGYAPRTAGMYGGRPRMNQQQAMTRPQFSSGAQVRQPFGGRRAVKRYYEPQAY